MKVLVTGGAGLIGSHTVDKLLTKGHTVRVLDALEPPTHRGGKPSYLPSDAEFVHGDIRNPSDIDRALRGVEMVCHLAATGGFTADISRYMEVNSLGTARLLEAIRDSGAGIRKVVVASSVAVYGEGKYQCSVHGLTYPGLRPPHQMEKGTWGVLCPRCGLPMTPCPISEDTPLRPETPYSISKMDQERLVLIWGRTYGIPVVALRYFVTYGPRQSLRNPYTGVLSIFATRIRNGLPPLIFEDGLQSRDFVYVEDVAAANVLALEQDAMDQEVYNVGTGQSITLKEVAETLLKGYGSALALSLSGEFRPGDVRHAVADISKIRGHGYQPRFTFAEGVQKYLAWVENQTDVEEYFSQAHRALGQTGMVRKVLAKGGPTND